MNKLPRRILYVFFSLVILISARTLGTYSWHEAFIKINEFIGGSDGFGNLIVTKTVVTPDSSPLTQTQTDTGFTFTLYLSDTGQHAYEREDGTTGLIKSSDTFQLKHGQTLTVKNLPVGTWYMAVETPDTGYSISSANHQGNILPGNTTAAFINTALPDSTGRLVIHKEVTGDAADANQAFTFRVSFPGLDARVLYSIGGEDMELTSGGALSLLPGETAVFDGLPAGAPYEVTELDDGAGYLPGMKQYSGNIVNGEVYLPFLNYKSSAPEIGGGDLSFTKQVTGSAADPAAEFHFTVTFDIENAMFTSGSGLAAVPGAYEIDGLPYAFSNGGAVTLRDGETAVFHGLDTGIPYTVREENAEGYLPGIEEVDGVTVDGGIAFSFINDVIDRTDKTGKLIIRKNVSGLNADLQKEFTFHMTAGETAEEFTLKAGDSKEIDLPQGVYYEVYEDDYSAGGYLLKSLINGQGMGNGGTIEVMAENVFMEITPEPSISPNPTPASTLTPSPAPVQTHTPSPALIQTQTPSPTHTQTQTPSPTHTQTQTPSPALTQAQTPSPALTQAQTPSPALIQTQTPSPTAPLRQAEKPTVTVTPALTAAPSDTTPTQTPTPELFGPVAPSVTVFPQYPNASPQPTPPDPQDTPDDASYMDDPMRPYGFALITPTPTPDDAFILDPNMPFGSSPLTGDMANSGLWFLILAISAVIMRLVLVRNR